jgi:hypothetical protein
MSDAAGRRRHLIFHFTHIGNLPGILMSGSLCADSLVNRGSDLLVEAADPDIKHSRRTIPISLPPRGFVADYVPFYFAPRSPMLYKLARGGVPTYSDGQDPLIYLVSTVEAVDAAGLPWLFSDGNCAAAVTQLYNDLDDLDTVVDWEVMAATIWKNTADDPDRMRRRMAEFLVYERLPLPLLMGVVVRGPHVKEQVETVLDKHGATLPVGIRPRWYF